MKRKLLSVLLAVTLVAGMLTGCGSKEEAPEAAPSAAPAETAAPEATPDAAPAQSPAADADQTGTGSADGLKIGVCYCMLSAPAVKVFAQGIQEKAKELGVELIELDGDVYKRQLPDTVQLQSSGHGILTGSPPASTVKIS